MSSFPYYTQNCYPFRSTFLGVASSPSYKHQDMAQFSFIPDSYNKEKTIFFQQLQQ